MRSGVHLGFSCESGREFLWDEEGHLTCIGPTGSSKTSSYLIVNALTQDKSKFFIDSKGSEITMVVGRYLATLGPITRSHPTGLGGLGRRACGLPGTTPWPPFSTGRRQ
jgi:hypothetical protein